MNKRAGSIRSEDLVAQVREVSKSMLAERFDGLKIDVDSVEIGWIPDYGTVGLILRDLDLKRIGAAELFDVADTLTDKLDGLSDGASPAVVLGRDFGTVGFFPRDGIELGRFR
jgi:hypothetical protein